MKEERIVNVHPKSYNGIKYRSTLEAETARNLDFLGIPFTYEARKIVLLDGFYCPFQKEKVRQITYTPDFEIGNIMIECKGFETPEWRNKKKYLFKYLMDNEPDTIFYQIHDSRKSLLEVLDKHWQTFGYRIEVTSKKRDKKTREPLHHKVYDSLQEAMEDLGIAYKSKGNILRSLSGKQDFVYCYNWKLKKMN